MITIDTFDAFLRAVMEPTAAHVRGEVFPYVWEEPSLLDVITQARGEPQARIRSGKRGETLAESLSDFAGDFRALTIEDSLATPVHLSLFDLGRLRQPGGALHNIVEQVFLPLTGLWAAHGLCWKRVFPILFLSGPGCSTNYHWDPSSVLFIQLSGRKRFCALKIRAAGFHWKMRFRKRPRCAVPRRFATRTSAYSTSAPATQSGALARPRTGSTPAIHQPFRSRSPSPTSPQNLRPSAPWKWRGADRRFLSSVQRDVPLQPRRAGHLGCPKVWFLSQRALRIGIQIRRDALRRHTAQNHPQAC
jgi:hypothetical protein